jgi:hypothetical protein
MPTPVYYWGRKPVYTHATLNALKPFIDTNLLWYFDAVREAKAHIRLMHEYRFAAYAQREYANPTAAGLRPTNTTLTRYQLIERAHKAWHRVDSFLTTKKTFHKWFYKWDYPFPEQLLNQDRLFYKNVMERTHYQFLRTEADRLFYQLQKMDEDTAPTASATTRIPTTNSNRHSNGTAVLCVRVNNNNCNIGSP